MIMTNAVIDAAGMVRAWVETDTKQLIMLKFGSAKELHIEDVKELDEKTVFAAADKFLVAQAAEQATAKERRITEIDQQIIALTNEKAELSKGAGK